MLAQALVVAWSFTLSNLGTTPQTIDLGTTPTDSSYVPFAMIIRGEKQPTPVQELGLTISLGTSPNDTTNVQQPMEVDGRYKSGDDGYFSATQSLNGGAIVHDSQDLYATYHATNSFPKQNSPIQVDILAYASDNDIFCPPRLIGSLDQHNDYTGVPIGFHISSGIPVTGTEYNFSAAHISSNTQTTGSCTYKSADGNTLTLSTNSNVQADTNKEQNKWRFISYKYLSCFKNAKKCPYMAQ